MLKYIWPENAIAQGIVVFLIVLFILWLVSLLIVSYWLCRQRRLMERGQHVESLAEAARQRLLNKTSAGDGQPAHAIFAEFCQTKQLYANHVTQKDSITSAHIKAIFLAGWSEGRLEVSDLLKHAETRLFWWNSLLRGVLSIFIVIGLLGTLFGLADSLSQLSLAELGNTRQANNAMQETLSPLLREMKSSFAPSIVGILCTILGVLFLSGFVSTICSHVRATLERLTLTVWVPQLYLTSSQRLLETLGRSEQLINRNWESVQQVAELSKEIGSDRGALKKNLRGANKTLQALIQATDQINIFTSRFSTGVATLAGFQSELRELYQTMQNESRTFQQNVRQSLEDERAFHRETRDLLQTQYQQVDTMLKALHAYEAVYLNSSKQTIDVMEQTYARLTHAALTAQKAYEALAERNRDIIAELGNPLRTDLQNQMTKLNETMEVRLRAIQERFDRLDVPLEAAAQDMRQIMGAVDKRTEMFHARLQELFKQETEANRKRLDHIEQFNENIHTLLAGLSSTHARQAEQAQALAREVRGLGEDFTQLGASLQQLVGNFNLADAHIQAVLSVSQQSAGLVAHLEAVASRLEAVAPPRPYAGFESKGAYHQGPIHSPPPPPAGVAPFSPGQTQTMASPSFPQPQSTMPFQQQNTLNADDNRRANQPGSNGDTKPLEATKEIGVAYPATLPPSPPTTATYQPPQRGTVWVQGSERNDDESSGWFRRFFKRRK